MVISKWTWIIMNLLWKQSVTLSVWSDFLQDWVSIKERELWSRQAKKKGRHLEYRPCIHSSCRGAGDLSIVTATRRPSWQVMSCSRAKHILACQPCKAYAAGCQGPSRLAWVKKCPSPGDGELCHRVSGQRLTEFWMHLCYNLLRGAVKARQRECDP